jgi:hypothetical protein
MRPVSKSRFPRSADKANAAILDRFAEAQRRNGLQE